MAKRAFSLLEILLVVAIITILAGIFAPAFSSLFYRSNLDIATEKVKTNLYRAQTMAQASKNDSSWGVYLAPNLSVIFSGNSYATRDTARDEISELSGNISFSGANEIVFQKASLKPQTEATININQDSESRTININSYGLIY